MSSVSGQTQGQSQTGGNVTGTPDHIFNLVSVLYHALESSTTNQKYIQDAKQAGNNDLVQFFQQIQQEDRQRAQKAQQLLGTVITSGKGGTWQ